MGRNTNVINFKPFQILYGTEPVTVNAMLIDFQTQAVTYYFDHEGEPKTQTMPYKSVPKRADVLPARWTFVSFHCIDLDDKYHVGQWVYFGPAAEAKAREQELFSRYREKVGKPIMLERAKYYQDNYKNDSRRCIYEGYYSK